LIAFFAGNRCRCSANRDAAIGGSKIDNAVQVGHNALVGRHCVLQAHIGINNNVTIGAGARRRRACKDS
jgi:UDP-3-O-[3-hydroxymyristoyl] glucosamine N-acyltransferase